MDLELPPLGLPVSVTVGLVALLVIIVGGLILWLTGLLTAFIFFAVAVMLLYALHKMNALDMDKQPWLVVLPFGAFFLGLGLDKFGVLGIHPMSLTGDLLAMPLELTLLVIIIVLLVVDILLGVKDR